MHGHHDGGPQHWAAGGRATHPLNSLVTAFSPTTAGSEEAGLQRPRRYIQARTTEEVALHETAFSPTTAGSEEAGLFRPRRGATRPGVAPGNFSAVVAVHGKETTPEEPTQTLLEHRSHCQGVNLNSGPSAQAGMQT